MSSFNVSQYAEVPLKNVVPESSKLIASQIPVQDIIIERYKAKFIPQNGSTFTPNSNPSFKLQSNRDLLIPSSMTLHFKLKNLTKTSGGASSTTACFDDSPATSVFNRVNVRVGGNLVEDVLNVNEVVSSQIQSHASRSVYEGKDSIALRNWKWNSGLLDVDNALPTISSGYDQAQVQALANAITSRQMTGAGVDVRQARASTNLFVDGSEIDVELPASYMMSLARTSKLFPLAFVGEMEITLTTEQAVRSIVSTSNTDVADYEITDLYLIADMVSVQEDYLKVLASSFSGDPEMGYHLPVNCITSQTKNATLNESGLGANKNDFIFSNSTPFLKSAMFITKYSADLNSVDKYSVSQMPNLQDYTNGQVRLFVGSKPFPQWGVIDTAEQVCAYNTVELAGMGNVIDNHGLQDENNYKGREGNNGLFYYLFNFENVVGTQESYEMDSYDASLTGGVISFQVNQVSGRSGGGQTTRTLALFEHTRILTFAGGRLTVKA